MPGRCQVRVRYLGHLRNNPGCFAWGFSATYKLCVIKVCVAELYLPGLRLSLSQPVFESCKKMVIFQLPSFVTSDISPALFESHTFWYFSCLQTCYSEPSKNLFVTVIEALKVRKLAFGKTLTASRQGGGISTC